MIVIFGGDSDIAKAVKELRPDTVLVPKEMQNVWYKITIPEGCTAVVNCAGVSNVASIKDSRREEWIEEIDTNLIGSYNIAKACPYIPMVFIASVAGKYGKPNHSGYCASKAGVISLVQSLGMEGHNAYCISPGRVNTKMREHDYPGEDIRTRLTTKQVATEILKCIDGKYKKGSNVIIRKMGYRTYRKIDDGRPWKTYLKVK